MIRLNFKALEDQNLSSQLVQFVLLIMNFLFLSQASCNLQLVSALSHKNINNDRLKMCGGNHLFFPSYGSSQKTDHKRELMTSLKKHSNINENVREFLYDIDRIFDLKVFIF